MNKGISNGSPATDGTPVAGDYGATATECWGIDIAAAGDEIAHWLPVGWNWNIDRPLEFRVWFVHQSTTADAPIWKVHILPRTAGSEALLPVLDNIASGGTITFAAHTCSTTADVVEATIWTAGMPSAFDTNDDFLGISVECDSLGGASANEVVLIGLEIGYTVKATTTDLARRIT